MRTSPRRRAREFVLQGLYQRQLSGNASAAIRDQVAEAAGFPKADEAYFDVLWTGVTAEYDALVLLVFDRGDAPPIELCGEDETAERGLIIDEHRTRAAFADPTPELRAR